MGTELAVPEDRAPEPLTGKTLDELAELWCRADTEINWYRGDIALAVQVTYGGGELAEFAQRVRVATGTLEEYRRVAAAWPGKSRRIDISWSVHQILATQDDRAELLASRETWTAADARRVLKERNPKHNARTDYVPPPPHVPTEEEEARAEAIMRDHNRQFDRQVREAFGLSSGAARDDDVPLIEPPQDDSKEWPSYEPDDFATADAVTKVIFRTGGWSPRRRRQLADALWDWLGADELREVTEVLLTRLEEG
jgi:hypothetical protein